MGRLAVPALLCWRALAGAPSCLDGSGNEVDFWYIFGHPDGLEYSYADSSRLVLSTPAGTLDSRSSALSRTLLQAYEEGVAYAMWNDEHPDGEKVEAPHAHAKGVVAFTSAGGFWLTHSLPAFPQTVASGYDSSWEVAAHKYGQSYLCMSVGTAALQQVGNAMGTNWPSVYDFSAPGFADSAVPNFKSWTGGHHLAEPPTQVQTIATRGGTDFLVFSKSAKFGKDLYADLVAPELRAEMIAETWQNGRGDLAPACKGEDGVEYSVMSSSAVSIDGTEWTDKQDHSKWAVTEMGTVFCVGDINRQSGQFKRGGGTVCLKDASFARQMRKAVTAYQKCGDERLEVLL